MKFSSEKCLTLEICTSKSHDTKLIAMCSSKTNKRELSLGFLSPFFSVHVSVYIIVRGYVNLEQTQKLIYYDIFLFTIILWRGSRCSWHFLFHNSRHLNIFTTVPNRFASALSRLLFSGKKINPFDF